MDVIKFLIVILSVVMFFGLRCEEAKKPPQDQDTTEEENGEEEEDQEEDKNEEEEEEEDEDTKLYILRDKDLPQGGEGEQCKDNKKCEDDLCDDFLDNATACEKLPIKTGNRILDSLEALQDADFEKVDLKYLGFAFSIWEDFWLDIINKDYSRRDSREALEWIAETKELLELLLQIDEDTLTDIITSLVIKLHPNTRTLTYYTFYKTLTYSTKNNFFKTVLKEDFDITDEFIEFLHENIVKDTLCGNPNAPPWPYEATWRGDTYYNQAEERLAREYRQEACHLGVWFELITDDTDRARVARLVDEEEGDFINRLKTEGGLSYTEGEFEDANEWPDEVFDRLKRLWTTTIDSLPFLRI